MEPQRAISTRPWLARPCHRAIYLAAFQHSGWGGNHFVLGGAVNGGKIHGAYPDDLTDSSPLNIGRGRLIPTTPWEGLWQPVSQWFGVEPEDASKVLPNLGNFNSSHIIQYQDLFRA